MNCPSCRKGLPGGPNDRCPFCGTRLSAPVEGALATDPHAVTPNPLEPQPPIREIPGLRKRERTWKDEVRERVRERREKRSADLPLFRDETEDGETAEDVDATEGLAVVPEPEASAEPDMAEAAEAELEPVLREGPSELGDHEPADLFLRAASAPERPPAPLPAAVEVPARQSWSLGEDRPAAVPRKREPVETAAPAPDAPPVERPALPLERLMAAVVDLAVVFGMWAAVIYFASRVARVPLAGLWPAWPWLGVYLVALGLLYAGYFTGTTGQTLGKMAHRLHVLDVAGGPPGHARALVRAVLGSLGVLLAGGGLLPMVFDPARRTLHDRLLKTRVVKL